jgi:hypothetical protein
MKARHWLALLFVLGVILFLVYGLLVALGPRM